MTVFDGLNMDIRKWQDHIIHNFIQNNLNNETVAALSNDIL